MAFFGILDGLGGGNPISDVRDIIKGITNDVQGGIKGVGNFANNFGNAFTDMFKSLGQFLPLIVIVIAAVFILPMLTGKK